MQDLHTLQPKSQSYKCLVKYDTVILLSNTAQYIQEGIYIDICQIKFGTNALGVGPEKPKAVVTEEANFASDCIAPWG